MKNISVKFITIKNAICYKKFIKINYDNYNFIMITCNKISHSDNKSSCNSRKMNAIKY